MLLMMEVEYVIQYWDYEKYTKENKNKTIKDSSFLMYLGESNFYGWAMPQNMSMDMFEWVENIYIFTEDFIKNYLKIVMLNIS